MSKKKITLLGVQDASLAEQMLLSLKALNEQRGSQKSGVPRRDVMQNAPAGSGSAPSETFTIAYPSLYGFIGDPALYNGKNDGNDKDNDDVLKYETLANNVSSFNFTKLGLAHKTGETLKPIPVMEFVDPEEDLDLLNDNNKGKRHYFGAQDKLNALEEVYEGCTALAYTGTLTNITGLFIGTKTEDDATGAAS